MTKFMITNRADTKKDVSLLNIFPNPLEVCKTGIKEYFQVLSWIDITQICPLYVFCDIQLFNVSRLFSQDLKRGHPKCATLGL